MNHRRYGKKLGRNIKERKALFNALTKSLLLSGAIETTQAKAQGFIPVVEKLVKRVTRYTELNAKRELRKLFPDRKLVSQVFDSIKENLVDVSSKLTKIEKVKFRQGDNSLIVKVSFVKPYTLKKAEAKPVEKKAVVKKEKKL